VVTYHVGREYADEIAATGATVEPYPPDGTDADVPTRPWMFMDQMAQTAVRLLPRVTEKLAADDPDLVVHNAACLWGYAAARTLGVPAASLFTTFAYNRYVRSPIRPSLRLLAGACAEPSAAARYLRARAALPLRWGAWGLPVFDVLDVREPLNLVFTSREFQPAVDSFDRSYRFVGPCLGARPQEPSLPLDALRDPVIYASLGTVYNAKPELLRTLATALAPLAGDVVLATGQTAPADLEPLPANVIARRSVPQLSVLPRAALFVTHGGMNSANEALFHGVPLLVIPQGADQGMVAERVNELGVGLSIMSGPVQADRVRRLARRLLTEPAFSAATHRLQQAQREAGGAGRAADELERYLGTAKGGAACSCGSC